VGDFDADGMLTLLDRTFSTWRTAPDKQRQFIVREPSVHPGLFVVEKEISAPVVSLSHQMRLDRTAPLADHAALEILNDILGGNGFTSRLMERLRSDEGLTYGIYSNLSHQGRPGMPGEVTISYSTKKQSVARSIDSVLEEFRKMASAPVSPAEVEEQIDSWRNRFVFQFTDDFDIVTSLMGQELDDRPYDYDQQMLAAVQQVTAADVERVAKQYLLPADLTVCVFGSLTDEDRAALSKEFTLRVLSKEEVFRGGYDRPAKAGAASAGAWPETPPPGGAPQ
jgi:zinc protease